MSNQKKRYFYWEKKSIEGRSIIAFSEHNDVKQIDAYRNMDINYIEVTKEEYEELQNREREKSELERGWKEEYDADGHCKLIFTRPRQFVHALPLGKFQEQTMLHEGRWLVLIFAFWSQPDMMAFGSSMNVIQQFKGEIKLGLYSIDNDFWDWHPVVHGLHRSPLYLLFDQGKFIEMRCGLLNNDNLQLWLQNFLIPNS